MPALSPNPIRPRGAGRITGADGLVVTLLVGLDVAARVLPHAPDFTPVAATALFAASVLRVRALALVVPVAGMALGDALLGFYDWRVMAVVYATLAVPACAAWSARLRRTRLALPLLVSSSLTFFLLTNLAVWAFSPLYAPDAAGLVKCYVAALPFLKNMLVGDLFWGLVLFGGYGLAQNLRASGAASLTTVAAAGRPRAYS